MRTFTCRSTFLCCLIPWIKTPTSCLHTSTFHINIYVLRPLLHFRFFSNIYICILKSTSTIYRILSSHEDLKRIYWIRTYCTEDTSYEYNYHTYLSLYGISLTYQFPVYLEPNLLKKSFSPESSRLPHPQRVLNALQRTRLSWRRMIWLLTLTPSPVSKMSLFLSLPVFRLSSLLTGEVWGGGGGGAKSYNREKAWSSTNHSIPSDPPPTPCPRPS